MVALNVVHAPTLGVRSVCSILFGSSQAFFVVTFVVRFFLSRGDRRTALRALVAAMVPLHLLLAVGILLPMLSTRGSAATFFVSLPILSLTPLSAVVAFIRHDLWGSRALLSRVLTLTVVAVSACVLAAGVGAALAASFGVDFRAALLAAAAGAVTSAALVSLAVRFADRGFFPARAEYKPTVDKLSEHLTSINDPGEVARAVERTVKRWLACQSVQCIPRDPDDTPVAPLLELEAGELTLPITFRNEMVGLLYVGKKLGGALFTTDDLDLLRTIVNQAALALAHARSYRELEERRRQQAEAWRGERTALIETVAAEIAHEIRYPINFFRSVFQRGTREGADVRLDAEDVEIGQEEVDRLERLVAPLRRVANHRLERRVVPLTELAARAEVLLRDALGARSIDLTFPETVAVRADFDQATQVVVNLLSNALDAAGPTGRVGLAWRPLDDGDGAHLIVWDTGPGFEGNPSRLFAPWFTTKPRGTGLGLAIAQRIVRAHGWSIDAQRAEGKTQFLVHVPSSDVTDEDGDAPSSSPASPRDETLRH
jgi:signal transduction histidine kinase